MKIISITVEVVKPLNMLPDGTRDLSKSYWGLGGTSYIIVTELCGHTFTTQLQLEDNIWYDPCYQYSDTNMLTVLEQVTALDLQHLQEHPNAK